MHLAGRKLFLLNIGPLLFPFFISIDAFISLLHSMCLSPFRSDWIGLDWIELHFNNNNNLQASLSGLQPINGKIKPNRFELKMNSAFNSIEKKSNTRMGIGMRGEIIDITCHSLASIVPFPLPVPFCLLILLSMPFNPFNKSE